MNKAYLALVALLILVTVAVGGFAIYRTIQNRNPQNANFLSQPPLTSPGNIETPTSPTTPVVEDQPTSNNLRLTVTSPKDGQQFTSSSATIVGETEPNADVSVNDKEIKANASGKFQTTITLDDGDNPIYIFASNQNGDFAEWQATVVYNSGQ